MAVCLTDSLASDVEGGFTSEISLCPDSGLPHGPGQVAPHLLVLKRPLHKGGVRDQ